MLILSVSRCADVLSIDAIGKALREADQGRVPKNEVSVEYALPLRFIWLLMGVIYFFPGFWKFSMSQWQWAWSDNLKYHMYAEWFERGGWHPFFRLDQHPLLYKMCGLGVMLFEISFIFLIFFPAFRYMGAALGVVFHSMIRLFMNIDFFHLQFCYLSFINWAGLFAKIGKMLLKEPFYVSYEGRSVAYRRMMAVFVKFDIFHFITISGQTQSSRKFPQGQKLLKFIGISLLLVNSIFGFKKITSGWPFTCYPTFAERMVVARTQTITPYGLMGNKEELISFDAIKQRMSFSRFAGMIDNILKISDENEKKSKLIILISVMKKEGIDLGKYAQIRFYKNTYSTQPEKANDPLISRELLAEINL
jgi:hypothetical protein